MPEGKRNWWFGKDEGKKADNFLGKVTRGNVNEADDYGMTPLMVAANDDNTIQMNRLISLGADIDAKDSNGTTALMMAVDRGHPEATKMLIDKGADQMIKARRPAGVTVADKAAACKNAAVRKLFTGAEERYQKRHGERSEVPSAVASEMPKKPSSGNEVNPD